MDCLHEKRSELIIRNTSAPSNQKNSIRGDSKELEECLEAPAFTEGRETAMKKKGDRRNCMKGRKKGKEADYRNRHMAPIIKNVIVQEPIIQP